MESLFKLEDRVLVVNPYLRPAPGRAAGIRGRGMCRIAGLERGDSVVAPVGRRGHPSDHRRA